jgi:PncC family amidohydrolase
MTGPDRDELAARVVALLGARGRTLATAESLTGGQLAAAITGVPGSSAGYLGGVVSYATELKESLLGVPHEIVLRDGVVSACCAEAMARGVVTATGADFGLSTTGVAGPAQQEGKPVGTVFVGLAGPVEVVPGGVRSAALYLGGSRPAIQRATCEQALLILEAALRGESPSLR